MRKVLIVDDDPGVRNVLNTMLSRQGFDVTVAEDGHSAVRLMQAAPADLVITDIFMPDQDGLETIAALRQRCPEVKIIAMSGGSPLLDAQPYLHIAKIMGADVVFDKPVAMRSLLQTIEDLFDAEITFQAVSPA